MKTFTVTFHHSNNYGAVLQAYALQQTVIRMGHENTVLEYPYDNNFYAKLNWGDPISATKKLYQNFNKFLHKNEIMKREQGFADFHRNRMRLSHTYNTMDELRSDPPDAEVLITGSDQVWRFSGNTELIPARFLDFGNGVKRKFSYAASIENLAYTDEQKMLVKKWLADYCGISLREQSAADYIASVTGYETKRVLDPVFLLNREKWLEIAKPRNMKSPYILCYQVQSSPRMQEVVNTLKKRTGLRTVAVLPYSARWIKTDEALFDVTPEEFLYLYDKASIIVSASFHGTAFGLIFNKPVYAIPKSGSERRIVDLTQLFGLQKFYIDTSSSIPDVSDYNVNEVACKVEEHRMASIAFLSRCLCSEGE